MLLFSFGLRDCYDLLHVGLSRVSTCSFLNVWDALARLCIPKRYRFDEDAGSDENTGRGRLLLRQEQVDFFAHQEK